MLLVNCSFSLTRTFSHINPKEHNKKYCVSPISTVHCLCFFSYSLGRVFLIFFDINWTKNGYLSQRRLLSRGKNCAAAFRKLPMFHQRHKCLPYFSIKKWYWGRRKYWISFQLIFCSCCRSQFIRIELGRKKNSSKQPQN